MTPNLHISDFLDPINLAELSQDQGYKDGQIGKLIDAYDETFPDLYEADLVVVGCEEEREVSDGTAGRRAPRMRSGSNFISCLVGTPTLSWPMREISGPGLPSRIPMRR